MVDKKEFTYDKLIYSLASLFVIGFFGFLILGVFNEFVRDLFFLGLIFYLLIMLITSLHGSIKMSWFVFIVSIATHFVYGFGWLKGIISRAEDNAEVSWISR